MWRMLTGNWFVYWVPYVLYGPPRCMYVGCGSYSLLTSRHVVGRISGLHQGCIINVQISSVECSDILAEYCCIIQMVLASSNRCRANGRAGGVGRWSPMEKIVEDSCFFNEKSNRNYWWIPEEFLNHLMSLLGKVENIISPIRWLWNPLEILWEFNTSNMNYDWKSSRLDIREHP